MTDKTVLKNPFNRALRIAGGGVVVLIPAGGSRSFANPRLIHRFKSMGAVEEGAAPAATTPQHEPEPTPAEQMTVSAAVDQILEDGEPSAFTTQGAPKTAKVSELVGRKVTAAEIDACLNAE